MARQRFIHPNLWDDKKIAKLNPVERLFFIGCFSNADDEGRMLGDPAYLRSIIFKYDDLTVEQVKAIRDRVLEVNKNLVLYQVDNEEYLAFLKWKDYQKPKYPQASKIPPPPGVETVDVERWYVPKEIRVKVFEKCRYQCVFCGSSEKLQIDHIIPIAKGGTSKEDNLQVLCANCNARKSDKIINHSPKLREDSPKLEEVSPPGMGRDGLGLDLDMDRDGLGEIPPDTTETEREILKELKSVKGYKFNYPVELAFIRKLAVDFPKLNTLQQIKSWVARKIDEPLKEKSKPHGQLENWFAKAEEWRKEKEVSNGAYQPNIRANARLPSQDAQRFNKRGLD